MIELTQEQRQKLAGSEPTLVIDPETKEAYVLVRAEVYERIKGLLGQEDDNEFVGTLYSEAMKVFGREGWDDPAMDVYNELDPRKSP